MRKFLAVVKREYLQRVRSKMFIVATILGPLVMSLFGLVPALIFSIKAGGPVRVAVVDQTGKMYVPLVRALGGGADPQVELEQPVTDEESLGATTREGLQRARRTQSGSLRLEEVKLEGRSVNEVRGELNEKLRSKELHGYLVLPPDLLKDGRPEFFGRNTGDFFTGEQLEEALSRAVREQRLAEANIDVRIVRELSQGVDLQLIKVSTRGEQKESGEGFLLVFAAGFIIYLTILMYGQVLLGAVIEEKETRIAEILFSSVKPFSLMMGKLIGVSLVALTQLTVWGLAFIGFALYGVGVLASSGMPVRIPDVPPLVYLYFALFFLLGYFIYSTIYVLVGSMVTTMQEGGQLAMPIILLLVIGFYLAFPVIRSPDSTFAFWVSLFPFFSPITMLVRIITQTPPASQILLSLGIGFSTVLLLTWVAGRVYRVGMLMYGKKATIPELWRWVRQA